MCTDKFKEIVVESDGKNMNVMHFLTSPLTMGGMEKLLLCFLKASSQTVTVVIMNDDVDETLKDELLKTGNKIYFINRQEGNKHPKHFFRLFKIIKDNKINLIHSHNHGAWLWSVLCKISHPKLKLVYTIHDSIDVKNMSKKQVLFNRKFIDCNIAISEAILCDCVHNDLKAVKIYNGIETKKWKPAQSGVRPFTIINVARIVYYKKGLDVLVKALKECKEKGVKFVCHLVGPADECDRPSFEYLKQLIEELGLSKEIVFLGERNDISDLLSQSDLFILPSRYEGLPISLLEAMASGLPIIASNISGSVDLIKHEKNGLLFESENHLDLAEKIIHLYGHKEEMERLAKNAREYVQDFDISVMCKKYWNLYEKLLK